jgi:hypothetical protein
MHFFASQNPSIVSGGKEPKHALMFYKLHGVIFLKKLSWKNIMTTAGVEPAIS